MKKMIAMILILAMLVPLSSAVTADEMSATPTVEEILNEYHRRAFELETQGDDETASTWSARGGSGKTLEQETVDELTAAGYEAYNVTADNYDALEAQLHTDFGELGVDPNGSYIVIIGGVEHDSSGNTNSRARPNYDVVGPPDNEGGTSSFEYTQDGKTYTMRYVTVTGNVGTSMGTISELVVEADDYDFDLTTGLLDAFLVTSVDTIIEKLPIGTILSIWLGTVVPDNYFYSEVGVVTITGASIWTAQSIQIWESDDQLWKTAQSSGSVKSQAQCTAKYIDYTTYDVIVHTGDWCHNEVQFAPKYTNTAQRLRDAVEAYPYRIAYDRTGSVDFYLGNDDGEIIYKADGSAEPLFTHDEWWAVPAQDP